MQKYQENNKKFVNILEIPDTNMNYCHHILVNFFFIQIIFTIRISYRNAAKWFLQIPTTLNYTTFHCTPLIQ